MNDPGSDTLREQIEGLLTETRPDARDLLKWQKVETYWHIGAALAVHIDSHEGATYGQRVVRNLSKDVKLWRTMKSCASAGSSLIITSASPREAAIDTGMASIMKAVFHKYHLNCTSASRWRKWASPTNSGGVMIFQSVKASRKDASTGREVKHRKPSRLGRMNM
jgi:hypothetical protein